MVGPDEVPTSHRERKKAKTRAALVEVSQRLFAEQGYAATTLEQISAEVDIRPQTLLRYFESKAHLALAPMTDPLARLRRYLEDPGRPVDTLTAWREYVRRESQEVMAPTSPAITSYVANLRIFQRWATHDPVLVAMVSDVGRQLRELLAGSLARDRGDAVADLHDTLVAALLVAGRSAVYERWLARDDDPDAASLVDDQLAVIAYATSSLEAGEAPRLQAAAD